MIAERLQQGHTNTKYYQFTSMLEHVIDCFHIFVSDETSPYHPQLAWLTRKQPKPPDEEIFTDLMDECTLKRKDHQSSDKNNIQLSSSVRARIERFSKESRVEIVARTRDGCSPLFLACQNGLTRISRYLLDVCEADIEQKGRYETIEDQNAHLVPPIWVAAVSGHYDTVKFLIERGANVNSLSDTGSTPLRSVCYLCKDNDGIHSSYDIEGTLGSEPACYSKNTDMFSIDDDVDPNENDVNVDHDDDPYFRIVRLLVDNGADVSKPNHNGGTCLINSLLNYTVTNYIISHGADVNASDNNGKTALHYAIHSNRVNVAKLLLTRGANPWLKTKYCDDALQLCCIVGNEELFHHLITNYTYSPQRLSDAYKLLGSSILELHYDVSRVRSIWLKSVELQGQATDKRNEERNDNQTHCNNTSLARRRAIAYHDSEEFEGAQGLSRLTADEFRIQSLIITERILGPTHRETIQRILYRGTVCINSMRPDRCIDLWVYALNLLLEHGSIFNSETLLAARAIKKLFSDLISHQPQLVKFDDVYGVLHAVISKGRLATTVASLQMRPRSCLHEDIFDLLLWIIINLTLIARCVASDEADNMKLGELIDELVRLNPKASDGSSLIHICATGNLFEGQAYRSIVQLTSAASNGEPNETSPILELIKLMLDAGLEVDQINNNKLSALQVFCLANTSIRAEEKRRIIKFLVDRGAHIDRGTMNDEQAQLIRLALCESKVDTFSPVRLSCLAARQLVRSTKRGENLGERLARELSELIEMH